MNSLCVDEASLIGKNSGQNDNILVIEYFSFFFSRLLDCVQ